MAGDDRGRAPAGEAEAAGAPPAPSPDRPQAAPDGWHRLVVFALGEQRFGLRLDAVEQAVRLVEVMPLPQAPEIVLGVIDVRGRIVPVVDVRRRFRLPARAARLSDHLIVARTARRPVALLVDAVEGVIESAQATVTGAAEILPGLAYLEGVVRLADGAVFIHDLDGFLALEEERTLDAALERRAGAGDAA